MAHYLKFDPSTGNNRVSIENKIWFGDLATWQVEAELKHNFGGTDTPFYLIAVFDSFNGYLRVGHAGSGEPTRIRYGSTTLEWAETIPDDDEFHIVKFVRRTGGVHEFYIDGVSQGTVTNDVNDTLIRSSMGQAASATNISDYSLKYLDFRDAENGNVIDYFDANASGGTGDVLPNTAGAVDGSLISFPVDDSEWVFYAVGDTTAPVFDTTPNVTATTETGHTISSTLDETGTIYGVRLTDGAGAPSSAQVKAGQDSAGSAAPEATSVAATAATNADLVFSTGSASTAYDYYIVAEDDEGTPNVQASPTLVNATTAAPAVPGLTSKTLQRSGVDVAAATAGVFIFAGHGVNISTATAEYVATAATLTSGVLADIDLSSTSIVESDNITVVALPATGGPGIIIETTAEAI